MFVRCSCLLARSRPGFRPGGRPTFLPAQESRQRKRPCKTAPSGFPAMLEAQGRAELTSLRSVQTGGAKSVLEARCARALGFCASRRFRGGNPSSQQPTAQASSRSPRGLRLTPLSPAEKRRAWSPCAQRTSSTDSRRLFEQSVATRVRRGAPGPSIAGHPEQREGRGGRGELFAYFLAGQKVGRPPGLNPGTVQRVQRPSAKAVAFPCRSTNS